MQTSLALAVFGYVEIVYLGYQESILSDPGFLSQNDKNKYFRSNLIAADHKRINNIGLYLHILIQQNLCYILLKLFNSHMRLWFQLDTYQWIIDNSPASPPVQVKTKRNYLRILQLYDYDSFVPNFRELAKSNWSRN